MISDFCQVVKRALDLINPGRNRPLHVSFDIDSLDPLEAPATGTKGMFGSIQIICDTLGQRVSNFWASSPSERQIFKSLSRSEIF